MTDATLFASDRLLAAGRPRQPYPGLRPFEIDEWTIFFGREPMIDDVIELLAHQRLVVVHGASGSGKSSLVRAGVLPRLARQHLRRGIPWRTAAMRPSGGPLWNLAAAFASIDGRQSDVACVESIRRAFDGVGVRLGDVIADKLAFAGQRICILVDQFEELFRYGREISRDESQLFVELLAALLDDQSDTGIHAVVTMRSEFLGECARYDGLAETINRSQYLLPRMDRNGLLRAIRRPAELYGGSIDASLAEQLVADAVGDQDELPLIQHALMLLWHEASANDGSAQRLDLDIYRQHKGGVTAMLSDHADRVMAKVAPEPETKKLVETLFRALTDINAEGQGIRRPQRFESLLAVTGGEREALLAVIEAFRAEGISFLTPYPPAQIDDATVIDISHEALIRCWQRIADPEAGWLQREFQDGLIWRSLLAPAESFAKNRKEVLSPRLTEDRGKWIKARTATWCERYGGEWARVSSLVRASEAAAAKARHHEAWRRRALWAPLVLLGGVGLWMAADRGVTAWQNWRLADEWRRATATAVAGKASEPIKDCAECPEMVVVPAGTFQMGSPDSDPDAVPDEQPQRPVIIVRPFAMGQYEVTKAEYAAFVAATHPRGKGCYTWGGRDWRFDAEADWQDPGFAQSDRDPVACVSWIDAQEYVEWLSSKTGRRYRLASEAEWEYAIRAGTTTRYSFGDEISDGDANFGRNVGKTTEVGTYPANPWGLHDMHGNVWEWVEDCYEDSYAGAPSDGSARIAGDCINRVVRGGAWVDDPKGLRSADRVGAPPGYRDQRLGFRLFRMLTSGDLTSVPSGFGA